MGLRPSVGRSYDLSIGADTIQPEEFHGSTCERINCEIRYTKVAYRASMISFEASIVCYTTRLSNTGYLILVLGSEPTCLTIIVDQITS